MHSVLPQGRCLRRLCATCSSPLLRLLALQSNSDRPVHSAPTGPVSEAAVCDLLESTVTLMVREYSAGCPYAELAEVREGKGVPSSSGFAAQTGFERIVDCSGLAIARGDLHVATHTTPAHQQGLGERRARLGPFEGGAAAAQSPGELDTLKTQHPLTHPTGPRRAPRAPGPFRGRRRGGGPRRWLRQQHHRPAAERG